MSGITWRGLRPALSTRQKVALARIAYRSISTARRVAGRGDRLVATRGGIRWQLDLNEGIDFSIFLLGAFERRVVQSYRRLVPAGAVALDIGANIGAHALPIARAAGPSGLVHALEPTDYAFAKLRTNIGLNPDLAPRIVAAQVLLTDDPAAGVPAIPSSWPLDRTEDVHEALRSRAMPSSGARAERLDDYVEAAKLARIDFVKLDVDGNELTVLSGGRNMLTRHRPVIALELAPYLLEAAGASLEELVGTLRSFGLRLHDFGDDSLLPENPKDLRRLIPEGGSINAVARAG